MQNCGMAPLCKLGRSFEHANGRRRPLFLARTQKNRTKMSEDLFFFWSSPNFGRKIGQNLTETMFIPTFVLLKFFLRFLDPLFKILRTLLDQAKESMHISLFLEHIVPFHSRKFQSLLRARTEIRIQTKT